MAEKQFHLICQGKYSFLYFVIVSCVSQYTWSMFLYEISFLGQHNIFMDDTADAESWVTVYLSPWSALKHFIYKKQHTLSQMFIQRCCIVLFSEESEDWVFKLQTAFLEEAVVQNKELLFVFCSFPPTCCIISFKLICRDDSSLGQY